jgi:hypothetical protein
VDRFNGLEGAQDWALGAFQCLSAALTEEPAVQQSLMMSKKRAAKNRSTYWHVKLFAYPKATKTCTLIRALLVLRVRV